MRFSQATASNAATDSGAKTDEETGAKTGIETKFYDAEIAPNWSIRGNANGGYLLALAARSLCDLTGRPDPVTISAHYLSPGAAGPVKIATELVKEGRRFATARATMTGQGEDAKPILTVLGAFSDLSQTSGPELVDATPPDLPPVKDCSPIGPESTFAPEIFEQVEVRLHPEDAKFATEPSGNALIRGWFRLKDDEPMDSIALLLAADALPPTAFNAKLPVSWVPTVELTVHVRANPAPGWLRCEFRTHFVTGGFLEEDGRIWDSEGTLVAQCRQLALVPLG